MQNRPYFPPEYNPLICVSVSALVYIRTFWIKPENGSDWPIRVPI